MDTAAQWPEQQQGIGVVKVVSPMEANNNNNSSGISTAITNNNNINVKSNILSSSAAAGPPPRPQKPQAINCPRCNSAHTKFCYYNNYSLTQPRYFCKTCRRYWTQGGSLRNVPVGGGSRKNKRSSSSSSSSPSSIISNNTSAINTPSGGILSSLQNPTTSGKIFLHDHNDQVLQDLNLTTTSTTNYYNTSTGGIGSLPDHFAEFPNTGDHHNQFFKYCGINGGRGRGSFTSFMSMIPDSSNGGAAGAIYSNSTLLSSSATVGHVAGISFEEFSNPVTTTTTTTTTLSAGMNFALDNVDDDIDDQGFGGHVNYNGSMQLGKISTNHNHAELFNFPFEDSKQQTADHTVKVVNSSTTSNCTKAGAHEDHELEDHQQVSSTRGTVSTGTINQGDHHHHHQAAAAGYWNNINIGGGTW